MVLSTRGRHEIVGLIEMVIQRSVVAVPARLSSSRLPGKVLADIGGKPMIQRVLEQCAKAHGPVEVVLCTDSEQLLKLARNWGFSVLMTSPDCSSGSERIASVADQLVARAWGETVDGWDAQVRKERLSNTAVINVQGDQPFLDPEVVTDMVKEFLRNDPAPAVVTPVYRLTPQAIHNPAVVKTLLAHDGRALYFRALPFLMSDVNQSNGMNIRIIGACRDYGYVMSWLGINNLPLLRDLERLEQLRLIEAGHTIATFPVMGTSLSVDTSDQLDQARKMIHENGAVEQTYSDS